MTDTEEVSQSTVPICRFGVMTRIPREVNLMDRLYSPSSAVDVSDNQYTLVTRIRL